MQRQSGELNKKWFAHAKKGANRSRRLAARLALARPRRQTSNGNCCAPCCSSHFNSHPNPPTHSLTTRSCVCAQQTLDPTRTRQSWWQRAPSLRLRGMGSLATAFKHGTAWASIHGCTMVPHMLPAVRLCGAASSGKKMQLMAMIARRWPLCDYISLQQGCGSVAAKGNARRHRVSGVRARGVSTSPIVHIVHD